jgi:hypothetical protein
MGFYSGWSHHYIDVFCGRLPFTADNLYSPWRGPDKANATGRSLRRVRATRLWRKGRSLSPPAPRKRATYTAVPRRRVRALMNVSPLLRVPLASSLGGFYGRRARDVLTLSKRTAAAVPAGHKPRHSTMRPGNAVAPAPEVGVVDATIADRPRQQAHAGSLPLSVSVAIRLCQEGHKVALASPALFCVATNPTPEDAGLCLSGRSCGQHERKHRRPRRFSRGCLVCSAAASSS